MVCSGECCLGEGRGWEITENGEYFIFQNQSQSLDTTRYQSTIPKVGRREKEIDNIHLNIFPLIHFCQKINFHYGSHDKSCKWLMNKVWFEQNLFPRPSHSRLAHSRVQWLETGQQWTLDSELERVGRRDFNRGEERWGRRVSERGGRWPVEWGDGGGRVNEYSSRHMEREEREREIETNPDIIHWNSSLL